jgi:hypothetical protein
MDFVLLRSAYPFLSGSITNYEAPHYAGITFSILCYSLSLSLWLEYSSQNFALRDQPLVFPQDKGLQIDLGILYNQRLMHIKIINHLFFY